jgi:hypothetical protein
MSDVATVLVSVVSGFFSGGVGALLGAFTTRGDRAERFRNRLLDAADDLFVDVSAALTGLRDAIKEAREHPEQGKAAAALAWTSRDAVLHRSARIQLLFGYDSPAKRATDNIVVMLARAAAALEPPNSDPDRAEALLMNAAGELTELQTIVIMSVTDAAPPGAPGGIRRLLGQ